eukprot:jgi/Orpsp1_1/1180858/evm.model.c7180000074889.2
MTEITHPNIKDGWFTETQALWPGQAMTLKVKKVVHHEKSKYQDVLVFESTDYGMVMALDGVIQSTERDEFSYQEMIAHLPLNSHPCPKNVLVIGGGDGGVLREVVKHDCVESVTLCDIDEAVIRVSKQYLPHLACGFDHPKCHVYIGDGFQFLKDKVNTFDVIITDSSDPVGPAESLYQTEYFKLMYNALRDGGIISTQGECMWLHLKLIKEVLENCKKIYPVATYAYTCIPTYPSGQIGHILCSKNPETNFKKPLRKFTPEFEKEHLRYYNAEIHEASMVYPQFLKEAIGSN